MATPGKTRTRGWLGFLICLVLAFVFWMIKGIADHNPDVTVIEYPVIYIHMPENVAPVQPLPDVVGLKVSALGLSQMAVDAKSEADSIVIDLSKLPGSGKMRYIVCSEILSSERRHLVRRGVKVLGPLEDTIPIVLAAIGVKLVPVKPLLELELQKDYEIEDDPVVEPPAVKVSAPKEILDTLSFVYTDRLISESVNHDLSFRSSLHCPEMPFIQTDPATVTIKVNVDRFIQGEQTIQLVVNDPAGRNIKVYPSQVQVVYMAPMSRYSQINNEMFRVGVDLPRGEEALPSRLKVKIKVKPDFVKIIKTMPERVEYIIRK